jgi:hypothetical protein
VREGSGRWAWEIDCAYRTDEKRKAGQTRGLTRGKEASREEKAYRDQAQALLMSPAIGSSRGSSSLTARAFGDERGSWEEEEWAELSPLNDGTGSGFT